MRSYPITVAMLWNTVMIEPDLQLTSINTRSEITCPECGHTTSEEMPTNACIYFYECTSCGVLLSPKHGSCCVFCSYGSVPCPPVQQAHLCFSKPGLTAHRR